MTMSRSRLPLALCLSLLALAAGPVLAEETAPVDPKDRAQSKMPEGAERCISLHAIRNTRVIDGSTIVFEMGGNKVLVNRLPRKCPGLAFEKRFAYRTSLSQLCNTDVITVITSIGRGASCGLGFFEPWIEPEKVEKPADGKLEAVE